LFPLLLAACQPTVISPVLQTATHPQPTPTVPTNTPPIVATKPLTRTSTPEPRIHLWGAVADSPYPLYLKDLVATPDGGFIAAGQYWQADKNTSAWLIKFDSQGKIAWQRTYDGKSLDLGKGVAALRNGDFLLVGLTRSFGFAANGCVIRVDPAGDIIWQKYFGAGGADTIDQVVEAPNGKFAVAGTTESFEDGFPGWWLAMLEPDGSLTWSDTIHWKYYHMLYNLLVTKKNELVLVGDTASSLSGPLQTTLTRFDQAGGLLEDTLFDTGGEAFPAASMLTGEGNPLFSTEFQNSLVNGLLSVGPDGDILWDRRYRLGTPRDVITTTDGGYVLGGDYAGSGQRYGWLMKTNPDGDVLWAYRFDSVHGIDKVIEIATGNLVALGHTDEPHAGYGPVLFLLSPEGELPGCATISPITISPRQTEDSISVSKAAHRVRPMPIHSADTDFQVDIPAVTFNDVCQDGG